MERVDPKAQKGGICSYYLAVIKFTASKSKLTRKDKKRVENAAQTTVNDTIKDVVSEDAIEDPGFLVPVKNILIVEKLRKENHLQRQENQIQRQENHLQRQEIEKLKKENEELRKKFQSNH